MNGPALLDLNDVVDGQKIGPTTILFFALTMLAMVSDGFDLSAMGYIAPELLKQWHLAPAQLVPAFSAGIIGMMLGGPLLGILGDKYGRKRTIVGGLVAIGLLTLAMIFVRSTTDLVIIRLLTGMGLGGVFPNVGALAAEITPRRVRGRVLVIVSLGVPLGIALPGFVAATLVPRFGWHALVLVGGLLPLGVALACAILLPESIKYLMERGGCAAEVRERARALRPDLRIDEMTEFLLPARASRKNLGSPKRLFAGDFLFVTPLLWFCQAANQMSNFFSLTWLPTLLQSAGATTSQAGASASLFSLGGLVAGIMLLLVIDRLGVIPLVVLFVLGTPLVAAIALPGLSMEMHAVIIAGAGLCVTGVQLGLTALLGIFYPTSIRSIGTGWTQAAGRIGALAAPVAGGVLLNMHLPIAVLPLAPAALLAVGALACTVLAILCWKRFGGPHPDEFAIASEPVQTVMEGPGDVMI